VISIGSSYFLGLLWRIFTTVIIDWQDNETIDVFNGLDTFYSCEDYGWVNDDIHLISSKQIVSLSYYALTTLSTVGYGDFLPKATNEKMVMAFILLIGVTILSLIMNKLMAVLKDFLDVEKVPG
jgi:hypothetical protein